MTHPEKTRLEAVKVYSITGNLHLTAGMIKVPYDTLKHWKKQLWWKEEEEEVKLQDSIELSTRLQKLMQKTLDVVEDRLEKGDFVYDQKTGEMRRKPVAMRDAHRVFIESAKQRDVVLEGANAKESVEAVGDKLLKLADKFASLAGKKKLELNTFEGDVVEISPIDRLPSEILPSGGEGSPEESVEVGGSEGA